VMHLMRFPRVWNVVVQYRVFFLLRTTLGQVLLSEPRGSSESLGDGVSMASCLCKNSGLANKVKTFQREKGKERKARQAKTVPHSRPWEGTTIRVGRKQSRHRNGRAVQALTAATSCSRYATDTYPFSALATVPRPSLSSSTLHRPTAQAKNHNIPNLATLALQEGGNHDMGTEWHPFGGFEATCGTMFNVAQDAWSREMWLAGIFSR